MPTSIADAVLNLTPVVEFAVQTTVQTMDLFLQPPLIFFTGIVVVGAAFGLIKGFFRVRRR